MRSIQDAVAASGVREGVMDMVAGGLTFSKRYLVTDRGKANQEEKEKPEHMLFREGHRVWA